MSNEDKNLKDTLSEVIGETKTPQDQEGETKEGMSEVDTTGETKAGETPDYVSGIDISDIPEQDRPKFREKLVKKAKLLEDGYKGKFEEVADLKKTREYLRQQGLSAQEVNKAIADYLTTKNKPATATTTEKKEALRTLDKLLESAPYEQRQALEQMRTIIKEESNQDKVDKLLQEVAQIKQTLGVVSHQTMETQYKKREVDLIQLEGVYGKDIVDKYKEKILNAGLRFTDPTKNLFFAIVPPDELEQAILLRGRKPLTREKREAISSTGEGVATATEKIDVKSKSLAGVISDVLKLKR